MSERKVLKVGNGEAQEPPMPQPDMMPPMDNGGMPPMDNQMPMDNGGMPPMGGEDPNQFDTNFDAGVEANEEEDPKKYIQQLTGKLSQSLRKYNDGNQQPDVDLNKYVVGMIAKQGVKGLSPEDTEEILDKIQSDEEFTPEGGEEQMPPMDNGGQDMDGQMQPPMGQQPMPQPNESVKKVGKKKLQEMTNGVLDKEEKVAVQQKPNKKGVSFRTKPFTSPNFEK